MKRFLFLAAFAFCFAAAGAQPVAERLAQVWATFESDSQLRSSMASIYVVDANTGSVVFDRNAQVGLAPASTQKIITAASAYEVLGQDFRYKTQLGLSGKLNGSALAGNLVVLPSGDPTLGSWRWKSTTEDAVMKRFANAIAQTGVRSFSSVLVVETGWEGENIPGGWIWDDVGNYYGAGAAALNWRENQYDLLLKSGSAVGEPVGVVGTKPFLYGFNLVSNARAAAKGTGDNAYIYLPVGSNNVVVRGTIPAGEDAFTVSGAMPLPRLQFLSTLTDSLARRGIRKAAADTLTNFFGKGQPKTEIFYTETSPPLDSISYWFLKRSINLYGEALARTMAAQRGQTASTENGAAIMEKLWSEKGIGIERNELHLYDGSGLSPLNRVTTHAQVSVLQYARKQPWFAGYVNGFPEFNSMKLKSGTINRVKSFCGYHTSKAGVSYIVSFIVNNYNGSSSSLVQKMYKVLDVLK